MHQIISLYSTNKRKKIIKRQIKRNKIHLNYSGYEDKYNDIENVTNIDTKLIIKNIHQTANKLHLKFDHL